jgi:C4-type Zn-finger protein
LGGRGRWISEFEASLVYRVSSRTARATQRNPVSEKNSVREENLRKISNSFISTLKYTIYIGDPNGKSRSCGDSTTKIK